MGIFARITDRRSEPQPSAQTLPADPLPKVVLPPIHQPAQSLSIFEGDALLDPIPFGIGVDGVVHWDPHGRAGLQVFGGTGSGTTEFIRAVVEQCRTRGWQVIIADGFGYDFPEFYGAANVSYVGGWRRDPGDDDDCLAALRLAHHIMVQRSSTRSASAGTHGHKGFAPMLLVLGELAGLLHRWQHHLDENQFRHVRTMIDDLLRADQELRCYVLIAPASGWRWRSPWPAAAMRCDTVILGRPERAFVAHCSDPAAMLEAVTAAVPACAPKGRAAFISANRSGSKPVVFQSFWTYNPCTVTQRYPLDILTQWERFKLAVSDKTPALHPQLCPAH
jgi:hypothetical protein